MKLASVPLSGPTAAAAAAAVAATSAAARSGGALGQHARALARHHATSVITLRAVAFRGLTIDLTSRLNIGRDELAAVLARGAPLGAAAMRFLDDFHVVEHALAQPLPASRLPCVKVGGVARALEAARDILANHQGAVGRDVLDVYLHEYQKVVQWREVELQVFPRLVGLALLECASATLTLVSDHLKQVAEAARWVATLRGPEGSKAVPQFIAAPPPFTPGFIAHLLTGLRAPRMGASQLAWLEQWLAHHAMALEQAQECEKQQLEELRVRMVACLDGLVALRRVDIEDLVDSHSVVEAALRTERAGVYPLMNGSTRRQYRDRIADLSLASGLSEGAVAQATLEVARGHVGDALLGGDVDVVRERLGVARGPLHQWFNKATPTVAPAMAFDLHGIPADHQVMVLLHGEGDAARRKLETLHLANRAPGIQFALVGEQRTAIDELNARYPHTPKRFVLLEPGPSVQANARRINPDVRYLIETNLTTVLPPGWVVELVSEWAHPLHGSTQHGPHPKQQPFLIDRRMTAAPVVAAVPRRLCAKDAMAARKYALHHWRYFEHFARVENHGLVPDYHQEDPAPFTSTRTTPDNIGLQLLATVSACDLGLITRSAMVAQLGKVMDALESLARHRGHFYNGYDIKRLAVLAPANVSSVANGNLAAYLIAARQACLEQADAAPPWPALRAALEVTQARLFELASSSGARTQAQRKALADTALSVKGLLADLPADDAPLDSRVLMALSYRLQLGEGRLFEADLPPALAHECRQGLRWAVEWLERHRDELENPRQEMATALGELAARMHKLVMAMDFAHFHAPERGLLSCGYHPAGARMECHQVLLSEARLASFIAIAKGEVSATHWQRLCRRKRAGVSLSVGGGLAEYLMPTLLMEAPEGSLLHRASIAAVSGHVEFARQRGVPWGMAETAVNQRDGKQRYQYAMSGAAELALRRVDPRECVVAPYASALALGVCADDAMANLRRLTACGALGPFGFRAAVDYTRPELGEELAVVTAYAARQVGATLVALANALMRNVWVRRFHAEPMIQAVTPLLQEPDGDDGQPLADGWMARVRKTLRRTQSPH